MKDLSRFNNIIELLKFSKYLFQYFQKLSDKDYFDFTLNKTLEDNFGEKITFEIIRDENKDDLIILFVNFKHLNVEKLKEGYNFVDIGDDLKYSNGECEDFKVENLNHLYDIRNDYSKPNLLSADEISYFKEFVEDVDNIDNDDIYFTRGECVRHDEYAYESKCTCFEDIISYFIFLKKLYIFISKDIMIKKDINKYYFRKNQYSNDRDRPRYYFDLNLEDNNISGGFNLKLKLLFELGKAGFVQKFSSIEEIIMASDVNLQMLQLKFLDAKKEYDAKKKEIDAIQKKLHEELQEISNIYMNVNKEVSFELLHKSHDKYKEYLAQKYNISNENLKEIIEKIYGVTPEFNDKDKYINGDTPVKDIIEKNRADYRFINSARNKKFLE